MPAFNFAKVDGARPVDVVVPLDGRDYVSYSISYYPTTLTMSYDGILTTTITYSEWSLIPTTIREATNTALTTFSTPTFASPSAPTFSAPSFTVPSVSVPTFSFSTNTPHNTVATQGAGTRTTAYNAPTYRPPSTASVPKPNRTGRIGGIIGGSLGGTLVTVLGSICACRCFKRRRRAAAAQHAAMDQGGMGQVYIPPATYVPTTYEPPAAR